MGIGFLVFASRRRTVFLTLVPDRYFGAFLARALCASGETRRDVPNAELARLKADARA